MKNQPEYFDVKDKEPNLGDYCLVWEPIDDPWLEPIVAVWNGRSFTNSGCNLISTKYFELPKPPQS